MLVKPDSGILMILSLLFSFSVVVLIGLTLVGVLWPREDSVRAQLPLKLCLAVGIGFGVLSCVYFLELSLFGPSRRAFIATQITLLAVLLVIFFLRMRSPRRSIPTEAVEEQPSFKLRRILSVVFIVALVSSTAAFIFISLKQPHGEWDAWAVYNMKARFLFRAGEYWRELFSEPMGWTSRDYPLLIPAAIAACWTLVGRETTAASALIGFLFTLATIGVVASGVAVLRGKSQGLLAGIILVCTPFLIRHGANQYTDIPLAFFFAATIALLHLQDSFTGGKKGMLLLAGVTTALSAWTKNEGLLFLLAVVVSRFLVVIRERGLKGYLSQMRSFIIGITPVLLVLIYFKITLATPNRMLFPVQGSPLAEKLADASRYGRVLEGFVDQTLGFGEWSVSIIPILVFYLLMIGMNIKQNERASIAASLIAFGIMLVGYYVVFVLSPLDVSLHLTTSANRVFAELWPSFIFVLFLVARTPDQALSKRDSIASQG